MPHLGLSPYIKKHENEFIQLYQFFYRFLIINVAKEALQNNLFSLMKHF